MEVEIKAICPDFKKIIKKLKNKGAKYSKKVWQIDIYFNTPSHDLRKTNEYLRIRHLKNGKKGMFAYHQNLKDGVNKEFEVEISDYKTFIRILEKFGFKKLGIINKKRTVYLLNNFKISLDDVKNIGKFIEIESSCQKKKDINLCRDQCLAVLENLGISSNKLVNIWLADIATGKTKTTGDSP